MSHLDRYKFVFLCGLHRSGTSPLFRMLREHPDISGFRNTGVPEDEGQHLQTVIPAAKFFGGPGHFGFAPKAHLTEGSHLANVETGERLFKEWSKYWSLARPCLLEKSPPNLIRTRFLQTLFPSCYFVVILRHPIAVSLATAKWTDSTLGALMAHWVHCHKLFENDRPYLRNIIVIKYEDLICGTQKQLDKIYKFIDLAPLHSTPLDAAGNQRYFEAWRRLSIENKPSFEQIVTKYESEIQRYGYSLLDYEPAVPVGVPLRSGAITARP